MQRLPSNTEKADENTRRRIGVFFSVRDVKRAGTSGFKIVNVLQPTNNWISKGNSKNFPSCVFKICTLASFDGHTAQKQYVVLFCFIAKILKLSDCCCCRPAGEHRLSGEDGAHHQGVPHPGQPLGSVLQPMPRTHGDLHTGTTHLHWRVKCQTTAMRGARKGENHFCLGGLCTPRCFFAYLSL